MILILGGVIRNGNPWISYQINMQVYEYIFDMILVISKPPYFIHQSARYYAKRLNSMSFQCPTFGVKKYKLPVIMARVQYLHILQGLRKVWKSEFLRWVLEKWRHQKVILKLSDLYWILDSVGWTSWFEVVSGSINSWFPFISDIFREITFIKWLKSYKG